MSSVPAAQPPPWLDFAPWRRSGVGAVGCRCSGDFSEHNSLAEPGFASQQLPSLTNTSSGGAARERFVSGGAAGLLPA